MFTEPPPPGSLRGKKVTLTFDNGPFPDVTDRVLDALAAFHISSTFFVVGQRLAEPGMRELAQRAHAEGHWVGNHTYTHSTSLGDADDPAECDREIGRTQALLGDLAHPDRFFRPRGAGGSLDRHLLSADAVRYLEDGAYSMVLWTSVPRDWEYPDSWGGRCVDDLRATDRSVVVLHDMPTGAMNGLHDVLGRLVDAGVEFVQEFPDACVPLRNGVLHGSIDHLMPASGGE